MRGIKAKLDFQMNYGASKETTTLRESYGKYLENTSCITLRYSLCSNEKLEIARYKDDTTS